MSNRELNYYNPLGKFILRFIIIFHGLFLLSVSYHSIICGSSVISYITYVRNAIVCLSLKNINLLINYSLLAKEKLCKK